MEYKIMDNIINNKIGLLDINNVEVELSKKPFISIIIVNKNCHELLEQCVKSIISQSYSGYEIIIGDTGSDFDNKIQLKKLYKKWSNIINLKVIDLKQYHFSSNNNELVQYINDKSEILFFVNNDIKMINNVIEQHIAFHNNLNTGCVGSQLLFGDHSIQHQGIKCEYNSYNDLYTFGHYGYKTTDYKNENNFVLGVTGALLSIKKDLFKRVGGFNTDYELFQDVILNIECLKLNKENIVVNSSLSYHYESSSRHKTIKDKMIDKQKINRDLIKIQNYMKNNIQYIDKKMIHKVISIRK